MPALGVTVTDRSAAPARGVPTDTGTVFVVGAASSGVSTPVEITSMADFEAAFATRTGVTTPAWDWFDAFFREGGAHAYFVRISGVETYVDGLGRLPADLGPGQVALADPGTPDAAQYTALLGHAQTYNRFALLDVALSSDTVAKWTTIAGLVPATNKDDGAQFGPWCEIPAPQGVVGGSARQVPASAVVAALCARADALGNPNRAPAGRDFPLAYTTGFVGPDLLMSERVALLDAGLNTFANRYGVLQLYGFQTDITQSDTTPFWQANCSRARMWIKARASEVAENYVFDTIDSRGLLAAQLKTELDGLLLDLYGRNGLFGETPAEAWNVQVGPGVNTLATIAQGELHAVIEARLSLHAKSVFIDLVSVPVAGVVGTT
jgi:hypothetical protein